MKNKHIYLHIGTTKTGTTSIQSFLMHNRKLLKSKNYIVYTPSKTSNKKDKTTPRLRSLLELLGSYKSWAFIGNKTEQWLNKFTTNIKQADADNIVLSEELLWNIISSNSKKRQQVFLRLIHMLEKFAEVKLIIYLRRQDYYIMSSYQQNLKSGNLSGRTCQQWYAQKKNNFISRRSHYKARLEYLINIVGKKNIRVRIFENEQLINQSLFADFMHSINLELTEDYIIPEKKRNPGLSSFMAEIIRCLSIFHNGKTFIAPFINPKNKQNNSFFNHTRQHEFLSPRERIIIMHQYKGDNEWVAKEFFNRNDGVLFQEPLPSRDETWNQYKLNVEEVKVFFANADFLDASQKVTLRNEVLKALQRQHLISLKLSISCFFQDLLFSFISLGFKIHKRLKNFIKIFSGKFVRQS